MSDWRAMNGLLVLRGQVNALAPGRSKASDGLVGDATHQLEQSDHNPHYVAGVGDNIVTALDLTHDPAHGFDSYLFAEVLRRNRDTRIKYVISNYRVFSSYATNSRAAWTWGTYSGTDPHTNHVHISVLDAPISDTRTPWNLEGFVDMTPGQQYVQHVMNYRLDAILHMRPTVNVPMFTATDGSKFPAITEGNQLALAITALGGSTGHDLTPEEIAALADAIATEVEANLHVPTAQENAEAGLAELKRELND